MSEQQYGRIQAYVEEIIAWNERVNLVSRRTCTPESIFARHIVPSLVAGRVLEEALLKNDQGNTLHVIDVGTGGGFPGIPLAILYPQIHFVLADSIGKKISAVTAMAKDLKLSNVATYNGRVEDYFASPQMDTSVSTRKKFDIVTGRSVTSLPKFCALVRDLLDPNHGHVLYLTGGEIELSILELSIRNVAMEEYLPPFWKDNCDKRVLVFPYAAVRAIAALLPKQEQRTIHASRGTPPRQPSRPDGPGRGLKRPKGAWQKKNDPEQPKQRGYENFQRYTSAPSSDD
jgi:16S rRNA (guanine527-N7)-methyltransferase